MQFNMEYWPVDRLVEYGSNPRIHEQEMVEKLAAAIGEFGFRVPIVAKSDGTIVDGHMRLKAARFLGLENVPVLPADDMSDEQIRAFRIAVNKMAELAEWDLDLLAEEVQGLDLDGFDIDLLGFDDDFLSDLLDIDLDGDGEELSEDDEDVPEPQSDLVSVLGDIWALGRHRLMCGDATSVDAVDELMGGGSPDMVFTDPPYGIEHSGKGIAGETAGNDFGEILGDDDVSVAVDAFGLCAGQWPGSRMIFWGANYYPSALPDGHGWLVWDKQREGDTFSGAELAFVNCGVRVDVFRHTWHGMIKDSEHGQKRVHPTQKPVALAEWCFERYGDPDVVLDLFGGSGSTLIACENTNRRCYMMELDPRYVDVIIRRWQNHTGKKATLEGDGRTFEEVENKKLRVV